MKAFLKKNRQSVSVAAKIMELFCRLFYPAYIMCTFIAHGWTKEFTRNGFDFWKLIVVIPIAVFGLWYCNKSMSDLPRGHFIRKVFSTVVVYFILLGIVYTMEAIDRGLVNLINHNNATLEDMREIVRQVTGYWKVYIPCWLMGGFFSLIAKFKYNE